ncbi:hypothetical protein KC19_VG080700 [Ceratodon purpureus]|uniref:Uncharacterized protein n=1 Tax=Ceratodon purpureus TaxID=3225 RepID=A0A8T0HN95_CERPU|nr:hypothetical protein KC19_VG080700 [Ceratodon purpureus]
MQGWLRLNFFYPFYYLPYFLVGAAGEVVGCQELELQPAWNCLGWEVRHSLLYHVPLS